ncbi:MAG: FKBP-type peptidyl-prolyl cis-trans isomerase [Patescibacteria group bacterium]
MSKNIIIILAILFIAGIAGFFVYNKNQTPQQGAIINTMMNKNGVQIEVLKVGTGVVAKNGDTVTVHYVGTLENGVKFDSSIDRGIPFEFHLGAGQVIPGWEIGVEGMKVGEKRKLIIPSKLAYGERGAGNTIPPNAILIFEVELLNIK